MGVIGLQCSGTGTPIECHSSFATFFVQQCVEGFKVLLRFQNSVHFSKVFQVFSNVLGLNKKIGVSFTLASCREMPKSWQWICCKLLQLCWSNDLDDVYLIVLWALSLPYLDIEYTCVHNVFVGGAASLEIFIKRTSLWNTWELMCK
jgi:hypothetical protein